MKSAIIFPWSHEVEFASTFQTINDSSSFTEITVVLLLPSSAELAQLREKIAFSLSNAETIHFREIIDEEKLSIEKRLAKVEAALAEVMRQNNEHLYLLLHSFPTTFLQMVTHYCISTHYNRLTVLSSSKQEQGFELESMQVKPYLLKERLSHHFYELVTSDNYRAAHQLIANYHVSAELERLLEFGQELLSLQIRRNHNGRLDPFEVLIANLEKYGEHEQAQYAQEMKKLQYRDQKTFIKFLYNYAEMLYKENDLIDFIVLYYRLAEETLLYALGWDMNPKQGLYQNGVIIRNDKSFYLRVPKEKVTNHFHSYMRVLKREIRKIERQHHIAIRRNSDLEQLPAWKRHFAELYLFYTDKGLTEILALRHEGVSGHGFADFTKAKFEEICDGQPLEKMVPILAKLQLLPEYSLFDLLQKGILRVAAHEKKEIELQEIG